jgi:hypothetical protein
MLDFHDQIPELAGGTCRSLIVQEYWYEGELVSEANVLFLQLDEGWHRFFIDAGVVFWQAVAGPEAPPDSGLHRYRHTDFGSRHDLVGRKLERVCTADLPDGGEIQIAFEGGRRLVLQNVNDESSLVVENERAAS